VLGVQGKGRWALAAEDEPEVLRLTATYLSQAGFRVITAQDGQQAEQILLERRAEISVAVLDVVMPIKSGPSILAALGQNGLQIPTVFVTGYDDEALPATLHQNNVMVLRKPFSPKELLARVALVLTASR
jgi:DNA-binding response OmpR family regulator